MWSDPTLLSICRRDTCYKTNCLWLPLYLTPFPLDTCYKCLYFPLLQTVSTCQRGMAHMCFDQTLLKICPWSICCKPKYQWLPLYLTQFPPDTCYKRLYFALVQTVSMCQSGMAHMWFDHALLKICRRDICCKPKKQWLPLYPTPFPPDTCYKCLYFPLPRILSMC